jgi:hypothetical protein
MARYTIRLNYIATFTTVVEGEFRNEGDALDAAREQAEDADMDEFSIEEEGVSQILEVK